MLAKSYIFIIDKIFKIIYVIWNRASFKKINKSIASDFDTFGFARLKISKEDKISLDLQLENIYRNAISAVDFSSRSSHDLSCVGNIPLSLESLATKDQIDELTKITLGILHLNPEVGEYLGLEVSQLSLELTLLCNINTLSGSPKVGSQNFHRDIYHSFYRGIKIFYAYNYSDDLGDGAFSFIPLTMISANDRPSNKHYSRKKMEQRRFDLHPLIIKALPEALILKEKELMAIDTYNCFHSGGYVTSPSFIRLIFQVVVSPPQTPNRYSDITRNHFSRMLYFNLIRVRNIIRWPRR